jgi:hypothetical protein
VDTTTIPARGLRSACRNFLKDLEAMPEDAFEKNFGGATRTVADIVYEVNLVNDHIGMQMRGEEPFEWKDEGWIKAPADFRGKETVINAFKTSSEKILAAADALSAAEMDAPIQGKDGETSQGARCRFMTLHVWYHSGQVNFIQTLLGDDAWHWG